MHSDEIWRNLMKYDASCFHQMHKLTHHLSRCISVKLLWWVHAYTCKPGIFTWLSVAHEELTTATIHVSTNNSSMMPCKRKSQAYPSEGNCKWLNQLTYVSCTGAQARHTQATRSHLHWLLGAVLCGPRFSDSQILRFSKSQTYKFLEAQILRFPNSEFLNFQILKFSDSQTLIQILRFSNSQILKFSDSLLFRFSNWQILQFRVSNSQILKFSDSCLFSFSNCQILQYCSILRFSDSQNL
jgi:hypothetical protein